MWPLFDGSWVLAGDSATVYVDADFKGNLKECGSLAVAPNTASVSHASNLLGNNLGSCVGLHITSGLGWVSCSCLCPYEACSKPSKGIN